MFVARTAKNETAETAFTRSELYKKKAHAKTEHTVAVRNKLVVMMINTKFFDMM